MKTWAYSFLLLLIVLFPLFRGPLRHYFPIHSQQFALWSYILVGLLSLVLVSFIAWDLVLALKKLFRFNTPFNRPKLLANPSRRAFLFNSGVVGTASVLTAKGYNEVWETPGVEKVEVYLKNLPSNFDGLNIVQVSDLHVGPTIKRDFVQKVVEQVNAQDPDVVVLTGDFVDGSVEDLLSEFDPFLSMKSKYGIFFVTGNHEYYSGASAWIDAFSRLGWKVLLNEHSLVEIEGQQIAFAGVSDYRAHRFNLAHTSSVAKAIDNLPSDITKILLAHQPRSFYEASELGVDLQISGHTHGGQYFPFNLVVYLAQPYVKGLHRKGKSQIYVNRGTGFWGPPVRLGVPSEITRLILRPDLTRS